MKISFCDADRLSAVKMENPLAPFSFTRRIAFSKSLGFCSAGLYKPEYIEKSTN